MKEWDSGQYMKFEKERTQPSVDLINRIDIVPKSILDIGCGSGNSTNALHMRFRDCDILGVDSSDNMLDRAKSTYKNLNFEKCNIPDELDKLGRFDLIFSNACLHWIPNHKELLPRIMNKLNAGGMLAVQIPLTQNAPFYRALNNLISKNEWKKLKDVHIFNSLTPNEYYDILSELSESTVMWETAYYHVLTSHDDIIEWYGGTGLKAYSEMLGAEERDEFLSEVLQMTKETFPMQADNSVILKMPRLFYTAVKA